MSGHTDSNGRTSISAWESELSRLSGGRERLLDCGARELAGAPELPPVRQRRPVDEDLGACAALEHGVIEVPRVEGVADDVLHLRVVVAHGGLDAADAPARHDRT